MSKRIKETVEEPRLVNHRWQVPSMDEVLDQMIPEWAEGEHPDFSSPDGHARLRAAFDAFGRNLLSRLSFELTKAAGKGIEQALALIKDPDYYETVKRRNKRQRELQKEWRERDEKAAKQHKKLQERRERGELTEDERLREMAHNLLTIQYHQKQLEKLNERKALLDRCIPIKERPEPDDDDGDDSDEWPDRISFD